MISRRRAVLVGGRLRSGFSIEAAMDRIATLPGEAVVWIAVVDRANGETAFAIAIPAGDERRGAEGERLASELGRLFEVVDVVDSSADRLAAGPSLT